MNVNYKQYCQYSAIKKQLRQRKATFENQQIQNIKPFMSHRKYKNEPAQSIQLNFTTQKKLNTMNDNQIKYKRQYTNKETIEQAKKQLKDEVKFKYSIEQKENEIIQSQNDQTSFKLKSNSDRIKQAKKLLEKYNTQNEQTYLKNSLNGKRKEVQSIIFDSKVRKFEQKSPQKNQESTKISPKNTQQHFINFQRKASQINSDIEAGLSNIQQLLKQAKKKKHQKSQIKVQPLKIISLESLKKQFTQRIRRNCQEAGQLFNNQSEMIEKQQNKVDNNPSESLIQLQGDFRNKKELFPSDYISFINRLSRQIQKDIQFTTKIQELTKFNQINQVKTIIMNEVSRYLTGQVSIDQSFFKIQQAQIDPLQDCSSTSNKLSQQEVQQQAINVFKLYKEVQNYFKTKLYQKFSIQILQLLFQQLSRFNFTKTAGDSNQVTIGHLLSYLNMRTNKCFRNRSFVKMLKRMSLKPNSLLTIQSFKLFISQ